MPDDEHACRVRDPDEFEAFDRAEDAETVAGREVDHLYGVTDADVGISELQSIRYPFRNGWDTQAAMLDAMEDCELREGVAFEPADEFVESGAVPACHDCGTSDHDMTPTPKTKQTTVEADGVVEREIRGEEREVLRVPISSTRTDREGDRFTRDALEDMADHVRETQPLVFDNHGLAGSWMDAIPYDARETLGTQFDAEVTEADDGESELFALVNPDHTHEEGTRMLKQVRDEAQAVKFSVGFRILEEDAIEDDAGNQVGREFVSADLMETSRVGIPTNPDASVATAAAKGADGPMASHPLMQLLASQADGGMATKADGGSDPVEGLRDEVAELRDEVSEIRDAVTPIEERLGDDFDVDVETDDDDGDGPEIEAFADDVEALRQSIEDARDALESGDVDDSRTGDPTDEGETPPDADTADYDGPDDDGDESDVDETDSAETTDDDAAAGTIADFARGTHT